VSDIDRLLQTIRANPRSVRYRELVRVLEHHGVAIRQGKGSHLVAQRDGELYTIKRPQSGCHVHPKTVKHCLQAFDLWEG
jgi:predicted RNA binding protein YcfA (HicA-like mRNA interferase family)